MNPLGLKLIRVLTGITLPANSRSRPEVGREVENGFVSKTTSAWVSGFAAGYEAVALPRRNSTPFGSGLSPLCGLCPFDW